jgi:hypothetical protein
LDDLGSLLGLFSLLWIQSHLGSLLHHNAVEFFLANIFTFLDFSLEGIDSCHIVFLFLMSLLLGEVLNSFMELFVFHFALLLLELLDFLLL